MRLLRVLLSCIVMGPCAAWAQAGAPGAQLVQALRAGDYDTAGQIARLDPDPVAQKLVLFYRLQREGAAEAGEIADFLAANPDWPLASTLLKRRDTALAATLDDRQALNSCMARSGVAAPRSGPALARCANAAAAQGQQEQAATFAKAALLAGLADADSLAAFTQRWGKVLTPADYVQAVSAMIDRRDGAATAAAAALAQPWRSLAQARLALRAGQDAGFALAAALPPAVRNDPALLLDEARALRRAGRLDEAVQLWRARGFAAEATLTPELQDGAWKERDALARGLLAQRRDEDAFLIADDTGRHGAEAAADTAFLSGFIALRRLHRPAVAVVRFTVLAASHAAISQARAHYWLAQAMTAEAAQAGGDAAPAARELSLAGTWPTTFYGQLALLQQGVGPQGLSTRIGALRDPAWSEAEAIDFAGRELARAAALLVGWGDPGRARPFLAAIEALAAAAPQRALGARLALGLDLPDQAVAAARRAGRDGTVLAQSGWPMPVDVPLDDKAAGKAVPAAVALGIMRQESSFDAGAISPSGARGLMQLMPATARQVGGQMGLAAGTAALIGDPQLNMRLGSAYLAGLAAHFGGAWPLAIAAYNAGPNRVDQWLGENGDPRGAGMEAMIDWVELIPFAETRNYVQRVIENIAVYRARLGEALPYPVGA